MRWAFKNLRFYGSLVTASRYWHWSTLFYLSDLHEIRTICFSFSVVLIELDKTSFLLSSCIFRSYFCYFSYKDQLFPQTCPMYIYNCNYNYNYIWSILTMLPFAIFITMIIIFSINLSLFFPYLDLFCFLIITLINPQGVTNFINHENILCTFLN